jgi:hypothetical protein
MPDDTKLVDALGRLVRELRDDPGEPEPEATGLDLDGLIAGRQAEVERLARRCQDEANGIYRNPEGAA